MQNTEVVLPPILTRTPGRPKHGRYKGADELETGPSRNQKKCGKCGGFGHNSRTCQGGPIAVRRGGGTTGGIGRCGSARGYWKRKWQWCEY